MKNKFRYPCTFTVAALAAGSLFAQIKTNPLFSDGMVLQRGMTAPVWGWTKPGAKVTVNFAGQTKTAIAGKDGKWMVKLDPLKANSKPAELIITSGADKKIITNVLVGEVWIGSGQSNMDYKLAWLQSPRSAKKGEYPAGDYVKNEIKTAKDPLFRHLTVEHQVSAYKPAEDFKGKWLESKPENNGDFSGTGYFFGRELRRKLKVPVGFIKSAWGATGVQPWMPACAYKGDKYLEDYYRRFYLGRLEKVKSWNQAEVDAKYKTAMDKYLAGGKKGRKPYKLMRYDLSQQLGSTLFKGMIAPLIPYAIKGVIWYQGESNRGMPSDKYSKYFEALIKGWRKEWKREDMPFIYAQLAAYYKPGDKSKLAMGWIGICEAQRRALSIQNTGMAVQIDIGHPKNIHPKNKYDLAKRLALWAYKIAYGMNLPVISGPLYKSSQVKDNKVIIFFDHAGSGLMTGHKNQMDPVVATKDDLKFFEIRGRDGKWYPAKAEIVGKDQVEVSSPQVKTPVAARYAWASNPAGANLYNKEGLPAALFTTE